MHLVWSNYMQYLLLLFIKQCETDTSLDFWWKHILTGRGRCDLGELLIGSMCLQCRQLQCYQCLILLPVPYYFLMYSLVLYCLLSPQPASQPLLLVVDWSQLSDNTRGGVIHHHHPISFFIICFKIRLSIIILTMTNLIITTLSHIFQSAKSWHSISKYSENWSLKCQCTCTAPGQSLKGSLTKLLQGNIKIPESKLWSQRQKARRASECRTKDGDAAKRGSHVSPRDFQSFVQMRRCPSYYKVVTSWDFLFSRLCPNCQDFWRWCWTIWSLKIHCSYQ